MPTPKQGESEKDFMGRCVPMVMQDGAAKDQKQAVAMCLNMHRQHRGKMSGAMKAVKKMK